MKFIDLFAGLGGFHKALSDLGHTPVLASEIRNDLRNLYEENWNIYPEGDIVDLVENNFHKIPDHDILCAGFPCQPFSKAGYRKGVEDSRGTLFDYIEKILVRKKPSYIILENVPHLKNLNKGKTLSEILTRLKNLGYDLNHRIYSPHEFGIPQKRDRLFIIGSLRGLDNFSFDNINKAKTQNIQLEKYIDDDYENDYKISNEGIKAIEMWQSLIDLIPKDKKLPGFPIWSMEFGADYPLDIPLNRLNQRELDNYKGSFGQSLSGLKKSNQLSRIPIYSLSTKRLPNWKIDYILKNREFYLSNKDVIDSFIPTLKEFSLSTFQKFEWNLGEERIPVNKCIIQFRPSGIRVKKPDFFPSLVCSSNQIPIIGWKKRYLSIEEASRLQGLEGIKLPEFRTTAIQSIGNAVNTDIVKLIAKELLNKKIVDTESKLELVK